MDRNTAVEIWTRLEQERLTELEGDPPTYDVRLDASHDRSSNERSYRVRVTSALGIGDRDEWLYVLETATEFEVSVDIQNSGLELL